MPLSESDAATVTAFSDFIESRAAVEIGLTGARREERPDGSSFVTRFPAGESTWLELVIRPFIPQVRVGVVTEDRWKNEELEEAIESTGDTMSEFIEAGFQEADLDWREPPVEHYRDRGKDFTFATPLELDRISALSGEGVRSKVLRMLAGYRMAFKPALVKPM